MLLHLARQSLTSLPITSTSLLNSFHNIEFSGDTQSSLPLLATASEALGLLHGVRPDIPDWFVWTVIFIISYFTQQSLLRFLAKW